MKNLFLTTLATLALTTTAIAQRNFNLINSATFKVPIDTVIGSYGHVPYVEDSINPIYMPLDIQQWQYIAITKDNANQAKIFKNGQLVFQGNYADVTYSWSRLDIGAVYYTSYYSWFNGMIDEFRISNIVRSDSTILNQYNSNSAFNSDTNTIGLWHFDQTIGTTINASVGTNGTLFNATWETQGKFGQCLSYNGSNARAQINQNIPTTNITFEFWIKPNIIQESWPISWGGYNTAGLTTGIDTTTTNYTWSTGSKGNSITVNPSQMPYVWVTDGNCTDTIWFDSQLATVYDTTFISVTDTSYISVTDTLIIDVILTGIAPTHNISTLKIYPNPASTHITVDNGDYTAMDGYTIKIKNSISQTVFASLINQSSFYIDFSSWSGNGLYFVHIIDDLGNTIETRKIIIE